MLKITKWALASRVLVLVIQLIANLLLDDHQTDVFRSPIEKPARTLHDLKAGSQASNGTKSMDLMLQKMFGGLRHWDGEYFLHIAEHLYSYENTLAFYPLFPMLVRYGALAMTTIGCNLSMRCMCLLIAVLLNVFLFCQAANLLYKLTAHVFDDPNKAWNATLLFCFNPASIFFTAAYSESLFACLTFYLMCEFVSEMNFFRTAVGLSLSLITRSNGLLNAVYPLYYAVMQYVYVPTRQYTLLTITKLIGCYTLAFTQLALFYYYAYSKYCLNDLMVGHTPSVRRYGRERNYVIAGVRRSGEESPWCDASIPISYGYVQDHYWNVGLFRYYEWLQVPNFLLAAPIIVFMLYSALQFFHYVWHKVLKSEMSALLTLRRITMFPFVVHATFLTVFCALCVHVQITTRMLCSASPCLYWFGANTINTTLYNVKLRSRAGMLFLWFGGYFVVGTVLFANNYPWT